MAAFWVIEASCRGYACAGLWEPFVSSFISPENRSLTLWRMLSLETSKGEGHSKALGKCSEVRKVGMCFAGCTCTDPILLVVASSSHLQLPALLPEHSISWAELCLCTQVPVSCASSLLLPALPSQGHCVPEHGPQ